MGLPLTLVYNPVGTRLPPPQTDLEEAYRRELASRYGIVFNRLFTITNMPIGRFLDHLQETGKYDGYMERLIGSVQSGRGRWRDVPDDAVRGLGRPVVRLRLQSDAGGDRPSRVAQESSRVRSGKHSPAG